MKKKARKKTCEFLQDSESLFRNQFKLSNIGMAITSIETECLHINPRLCDMLGYTEEELRLKTWTEISHPEDLKENLLQFNKMLNDEIESYETDNSFFRKDGTIITTHLTVSCFRNPDRSVRYVITSFQDITEKKRHEENLRRRNEELSALNRLARTIAGKSSLKEVCDTATREVASVMKTDMSVIFVRQGKELHLKACGPAKLWKKSDSADVHIVGECLCGLAAEVGQAIYCKNILEDKRCTWVECKNAGFRSFTALPLCYGDDTIGVLGIASMKEYNFEEKSTFLETLASQLATSIYNARLLEESRNDAALMEKEIAERREAEEALRQSKRQLEDIAANIPGVIFQFFYRPDGSMGLSYVSDRGFEITGLDRNSENLYELFISHIPDSDRKNFLEAANRAIRTGTTWNFEGRFVKPSGELIWFDGISVPRIHREELLFNGILLDTTEKKHLEEQLRQSQKMEAIGQLAGGVAHDFNNLLLAIQGYTGIVMKDMSPYDPRLADLKEVCKAAERAASLTKQLLAFSRRQVLQMTLLNMNKVIEELIKMLQRLIGENIELKLNLAGDLNTINADRSHLEQIVINLCVNARDAMPDGGSLFIETENVTFDSHYCSSNKWARPGRYTKLSITDSGCGMDEDTRKQIFEPFFTTKKDGKGTGLGLSMVYGIVRQHRGMVHVYSEPAKGSRFSIYLPAVEGPEAPVERETELPVRGGYETILLAEDDSQIRFLSRRILEEAGYHVLTASSGEEAINLYRKYGGKINLLFLDIIMPGKSGKIVYDEIRSLKPGIKCLFTSGYSETAVHTNFILNKNFSLIQKPYKREQLLVAVRQVLDREDKYCSLTDTSGEAKIPSQKAKGKILIVDDEESIRDICLLHIEDMGFHGLSAASGEEALKVFQKYAEEILCVVIDLQMPHMKGTETFREIKSIRADIPVIFSSGYGLEEEIDSLIAGGIAEFLYKPYNPKEFKDKITGAIAGFRGIP